MKPHRGNFSALDWWDARELDSVVQAARLADCNAKAEAQAAIYSEQPNARRAPENVPDPMSFCRKCGGKGQTIDEPEEYGVGALMNPCETCSGTGWR